MAEEKIVMKTHSDITITLGLDDLLPKSVASLIVREWIFDEQRVPRLELMFKDDGHFSDTNHPYQGKIITVSVKRGVGNEDDIYLDAEFKIIDSEWYKEQQDQVGGNSMLRVTAILNMIDPFEIMSQQCFERKTTNEIANQIAGELGVGYINNQSTQDRMNWFSGFCVTRQSKLQFLDYLVAKSFVGEDDCMFMYFDTGMNLNYNSLKTAISNAAPRKAIYDQELGILNTVEELIKNAVVKTYTEEEAKTNIWYVSLQFNNSSGSNYLKQYGYGFWSKSVDLTEGTFSFKSPGSNGSNLSSVTKFNNNFEKFLYTDEDPTSIGFKMSSEVFIGDFKQKSLDNVYGENYVISEYKRQNILTSVLSQSIVIEINPLTEVNLLETIDIDIPSNIPTVEKNTNGMLSGLYIVGGITHIIDKGYYKKMVSLHRAGFNSSNEVKK